MPKSRSRLNSGLSASKKKFNSHHVEQASYRIREGMTIQQQAHVYHKEGKYLLDNGNLQGAMECISEALSLNPMPMFYVNRAACYKHLQKYTEAYFDYSFAIRLEPDSGSLYCLRGLVLVKLERLSMAIEDLDEACRLEPIPLNFYSRASVYAEAGEFEAAIRDLTKVIEDVQKTTADLRIRSLHRRGAVYFEMKKFTEANADLNLVCLQDPTSIAPYVLHGKVQKAAGNLFGAEECLDHAILMENSIYDLYVERSDIRMRIKDEYKLMESIQDLDKAYAILMNKLKESSMVVGVNSLKELHRKSSFSVDRKTSVFSAFDENDLIGLNRRSSTGSSHVTYNLIPNIMGQPKSGLKVSASVPLIQNELDGRPLLQPLLATTNTSNTGDAYNTSNTSNEGSKVTQPSSSAIASAAAIPKPTGNALSPLPGSSMGITTPGIGGGGAGGGPNGMISPLDHEGIELMQAVGDVLSRRAQGKLLLQRDDLLASALKDAEEASLYCPHEEFYKMVAAVCHLRAGNIGEAQNILEKVLTANPNNEQALFHQAFCHRTEGKQMDAIESLTKIIAINDAVRDSDYLLPVTTTTTTTTSPLLVKENTAAVTIDSKDNNKPEENNKSNNNDIRNEIVGVPISRVFEMRGTIFHSMQVYKLAMKDLGRAVALNVDRPEPYFLRGDCHFRLGNYEQALEDYKMSEQRNLTDKYSLLAAKGAVLRLLGRFKEAAQDFTNALVALEESQQLTTGAPVLPDHVVIPIRIRLRAFVALCMLDLKDYRAAHTHLAATIEILESLDSDILSTITYRRLIWTLYYHDAMSWYMLKDYQKCAKALDPCFTGLQEYAPDPFDEGTALFFSAICQCILGDIKKSIAYFSQCLISAWTGHDKNLKLCLFARGKSYQKDSQHENAIADFSKVIDMDPDHANAIFRRAWSYKALSKFESAGVDFEEAKRLRHDDPNFSVQYKLIYDIEYMEIESDPDLMEPFPSLLPIEDLTAITL